MAPEPGKAQAELYAALERCVQMAAGGHLSLNQALAQLGSASYAFVGIVLCLPFLQPLSLGPLSTMAGAAFITMGIQLLRAIEQPQLPERLGHYEIPGHVWQSLLKPCSTLAHWLGRFSKPRLGHWIDGPAGLRRVGALLLVGGLLLAIPAPMIPFSNTIPVLGILCTYTALLERDGALLVVAIGFMALSALYFALLGWLALTVGFQLGAWLGLT
jgi:hypothetical protein